MCVREHEFREGGEGREFVCVSEREREHGLSERERECVCV